MMILRVKQTVLLMETFLFCTLMYMIASKNIYFDKQVELSLF